MQNRLLTCEDSDRELAAIKAAEDELEYNSMLAARLIIGREYRKDISRLEVLGIIWSVLSKSLIDYMDELDVKAGKG